jgi:7-cyano-7-deazaguanine synthase
MAAVNSAVVCLSGGMDSTSLLLHLLAQSRNVYGLSFDYGQKHRIELDRLRSNLDYLRCNGHEVEWNLIDLTDVSKLLHSALTDKDWQIPEGHYESQNMKQTVVPNRNSIFTSIAYAHALSLAKRLGETVDLCLGVHSGDHSIYPDCRPEFYNAIFAAFKKGNWNSDAVSLYLPYLDMNKTQILQDAQESVNALGLDFVKVFGNTITSYEPDSAGRSSGMTGSDIERVLAFHRLGIEDPIQYVDPWPQVVRRALELEKEYNSQQSTR